MTVYFTISPVFIIDVTYGDYIITNKNERETGNFKDLMICETLINIIEWSHGSRLFITKS